MSPYQIADQVSAVMMLPGLPVVKQVGTRKIGATQTELPGASPAPPVFAEGAPSIQMQQMPGGGTAILIRRNTRFGAYITEESLQPLRALAQAMVAQLRALSLGPLTLKRLAEMGHPYGRGPKGAMRGKLGNIGHGKGVSGGVGNMFIINEQSGALAEAWGWELQRDSNGVTTRLFNPTPESWFVLHGTKKMGAHGPGTYVPVQNLSEMNADWTAITVGAYMRSQAEGMAEVALG